MDHLSSPSCLSERGPMTRQAVNYLAQLRHFIDHFFVPVLPNGADEVGLKPTFMSPGAIRM
jgi:hypothetical protein